MTEREILSECECVSVCACVKVREKERKGTFCEIEPIEPEPVGTQTSSSKNKVFFINKLRSEFFYQTVVVVVVVEKVDFLVVVLRQFF